MRDAGYATLSLKGNVAIRGPAAVLARRPALPAARSLV